MGGANFHVSEINVGLYPREGRDPIGVTTRADVDAANGAGYVQKTLSLLHNQLMLGGGVRYDEFRFGVDARGVVQMPQQPRVATTDFYQAGTSSHWGRFSLATEVFLIDHSNEQVYIPDDGTFEFKGPIRSYGYEVKASAALTRHLSLNAGLSKIGNAYFLGGDRRTYVDSAPHFVANAGLTLSAWHGWSGSLTMRAINHYRLVDDDASVVASGHTVFDLGLARQIRRGVEFNLSLDNLTNRDYYETRTTSSRR